MQIVASFESASEPARPSGQSEIVPASRKFRETTQAADRIVGSILTCEIGKTGKKCWNSRGLCSKRREKRNTIP